MALRRSETPRRRMRRAVFIDKDGTVLRDVPYNVDPRNMRFLPGAAQGLSRLHAAGYRLIIITNQPGIGLGLFTRDQLIAAGTALAQKVRRCGAELAGFYFCPHAPDRNPRCGCRKPAPGLILRAARELAIDRTSSWMIGDILNDIEAGRRAGCRTVLINNGSETEWLLTRRRVPHHTAGNLRDAARIITARLPARNRRKKHVYPGN